MALYKDFGTDASREKEGLWLEYGDFRVRVARAGGGNKSYQKALEAKTRPYRRAIQTDTFDNDRANQLLMSVFSTHVVRGWETKINGEWVSGIETAEGGSELLQVNAENVMKTFQALPDLFADVMQAAQNAALFRTALLEEAAGN